MKQAPPTQDFPGPRSVANVMPGDSVHTAAPGLVMVGIVCSAGGLPALKAFVGHIPSDSGAAFVVLQYLAPADSSALVELLQSASALPVVWIANGLAIRPGMVYVTPEGMELSLGRGRFKLTAMVRSPGARLPIDPFFRSLAEACQERAIGVALSGMGSDGVDGLRAIKEHGGFTLVQDPATAEAGSMPRSAIEAGVVDVVAAAEALAGAIVRRLQPLPEAVPEDAGLDEGEAHGEITRLLRERSGSDFSLYKVNYLNRRFERRMAVHRFHGLNAYARHLMSDPGELDLLGHELLIGVTQFFRDPEIWDELRDRVFPELFAKHPGGGSLRAWVPACSTGEEAYSLAMIFREALARTQPAGWFTLRIFATDLGKEAIKLARKGVFPEGIDRDVSPSRLQQYFAREEGGYYRVLAPIRDLVVFANHNILSDPIFSGIDVVCCRNLLIYFGEALKARTLRLLCHALNPGGFLQLGSAETIGKCDDLLVPVNRQHRLFRRAETDMKWTDSLAAGKPPAARTTTPVPHPAGKAGILERIANEMIWKVLGPAAVVVNAVGDILHVRGRIGEYLEPAAGKTNSNIHAMARGELARLLTRALPEAAESCRPVFLKRVPLGGARQRGRANVSIRPVEGQGAGIGWLLVCFESVLDKPAPRGSGDAPFDSGSVQEALLLTRDALLLAQEEGQEAREELQTSNEELKALNEELATAKEELQSLNEEQLTINMELQAKVDELTGARDDLANLLNSIEIATLFLGSGMKLRRFNCAATSIFRLLPADAGRPLAHITSSLDYPDFAADVEEVIGSGAFLEKVVWSRDHLCYRVRITPYHHQEQPDGGGAVVSFIDITELKKPETELQTCSRRAAGGS